MTVSNDKPFENVNISNHGSADVFDSALNQRGAEEICGTFPSQNMPVIYTAYKVIAYVRNVFSAPKESDNIPLLPQQAPVYTQRSDFELSRSLPNLNKTVIIQEREVSLESPTGDTTPLTENLAGSGYLIFASDGQASLSKLPPGQNYMSQSLLNYFAENFNRASPKDKDEYRKALEDYIDAASGLAGYKLKDGTEV